jgi:hypothetical protein
MKASAATTPITVNASSMTAGWRAAANPPKPTV